MQADKKLRIGLFGFGVVGEGVFHILNQTPSLNAEIKKICIKNADKNRNAESSLFTTDANSILHDDEVNVVVELIDNADDAYQIVTAALRNRKSVVSANKKMIAEHLQELTALQQEYGVSLLYEAAVCGSIPIIRNLEEYYDNDLLQSVCGIVNGSTNYMLTKMNDEGLSYTEALQKAQLLGFAESNPALDVEGIDAANKLVILLAHAYGTIANPLQLPRAGISKIHATDAHYAKEKGFKIKLTAQARKLSGGKIAAFVLPQFVQPESQLYTVRDEFNGVIIESKFADKQFLYGKGAGRYPTASAAVSDISALGYDYKYAYKKLHRPEKNELASNYFLKLFVSFNDQAEVNKWDFEEITAYHSTAERQYITGVVAVKKLVQASWLHDPSVSVILLPNAIVEENVLITGSLKKISLQLAGVN